MRTAGVVILAVAALVACGPDDESRTPGESASVVSAEPTPWPRDLTAWIDQSRMQRSGRTAFVRLVHEPRDGSPSTYTVETATVSSPRFASVTWSGPEHFGNEIDLEFELPPARCGTGSDVTVGLTYRVDDGTLRHSSTTAADRYGAFGLFLDRDCAQATLDSAASVDVGAPAVVGDRSAAVLHLPVTITPSGRGDGGAALLGFDDTVLFRLLPDSVPSRAIPLGADDPPVSLVLQIVPARCDPHALAEDKVGTLFPIRLRARGLPEGAAPYLPLDDDQRAALRRYVPIACDW